MMCPAGSLSQSSRTWSRRPFIMIGERQRSLCDIPIANNQEYNTLRRFLVEMVDHQGRTTPNGKLYIPCLCSCGRGRRTNYS
jgi:hypothetical protein